MLRTTKNENDQKSSIDNNGDQATGTNLNNSEKYCIKKNGTSEIKSESRVLVLYTGGTIGMIRNESGVLVPKANSFVNTLRQFSQMHDRDYAKKMYGEMANESPLILPVKTTDNRRIIYEVLEYSPLCDSSDMTMDDWILIANDIKKYYNNFNGFVILHGTDTLSYTASALSFMLQDLDKIVILTGSQVPIFDTRNDGVDNFLTSLVIAANYNIPEVCVFFGTNLMRGNRTSKVSATSFDAFHSPNFPSLATVGINIEVDYCLSKYPQSPRNLSVHSKLNRNVCFLRLFPGITADLVKGFLQSPIEGVVLQTYGSGNIPSNREDIFAEFREATRRGIIIVNITQCTTGRVSNTYKAGALLKEAGVISGFDMTPEAALTKLAYVLSNTDWDIKKKRRMIQSNLRGELTSSQLPFMFESDLVSAVARSLKLSLRTEFQELTSILFPSMLNAAVVKCDIDKLKSLKEYGANISQTNADGRTALHIACCQGNLNIVQELLKMGANVNMKDRFRRTPLIEAIENDHHETINILLEHGAKLDKDNIGNKICDVIGSGNLRRLQSFLIADPNASQTMDTSGRTPLHLAALHNNVTIIKLLLNHGANPKSTDMIGHTPFDLAKLVGAVDAMECLTLQDINK
ncbi:L-asparaginase isoform X2 [Vespula maculifrons]|uniref:asparaginase n=1 Tax=Vespula maculifrons TaxID=7453 RepID=A0ABD2CB98_VESMC